MEGARAVRRTAGTRVCQTTCFVLFYFFFNFIFSCLYFSCEPHEGNLILSFVGSEILNSLTKVKEALKSYFLSESTKGNIPLDWRCIKGQNRTQNWKENNNKSFFLHFSSHLSLTKPCWLPQSPSFPLCGYKMLPWGSFSRTFPVLENPEVKLTCL